MLRTSTIRATRAQSRSMIARIAVTPTYNHYFARFESTKADEPTQTDAAKAAWRAARDLKDKLNHNWDMPVMNYEQVKLRSSSPNPVRLYQFFFLSPRIKWTFSLQNAYLIDVREPDEVIQGSIPSSVNLPLSVLANSLYLQQNAFKAKHGFDKPGKEQEIVFYCRSGKRSATACDIAKRNGYTK